jgi:hypothetical protein
MSNDDVDLPIPDFLDRNPNKQVATMKGPDGGTALRVVAGSQSGTSLMILDGFRREIADAKSTDEIISIGNKAIALATYARKATDRQLEAEAVAIQMEAERRLGQMMQQQRETVGLNKGGRPKTGIREIPVSDQPPSLTDAGIGKNLAQKARAAAALSDEEFQAKVATTLEAVRTRPGSRTKACNIEARAPRRRAKRGKRDRCTLEERLSQITAVCRYEDGMEIPSEFKAAEIDAAISTLKDDVVQLNKWIGRLEEARRER